MLNKLKGIFTEDFKKCVDFKGACDKLKEETDEVKLEMFIYKIKKNKESRKRIISETLDTIQAGITLLAVADEEEVIDPDIKEWLDKQKQRKIKYLK